MNSLALALALLLATLCCVAPCLAEEFIDCPALRVRYKEKFKVDYNEFWNSQACNTPGAHAAMALSLLEAISYDQMIAYDYVKSHGRKIFIGDYGDGHGAMVVPGSHNIYLNSKYQQGSDAWNSIYYATVFIHEAHHNAKIPIAFQASPESEHVQCVQSKAKLLHCDPVCPGDNAYSASIEVIFALHDALQKRYSSELFADDIHRSLTAHLMTATVACNGLDDALRDRIVRVFFNEDRAQYESLAATYRAHYFGE